MHKRHTSSSQARHSSSRGSKKSHGQNEQWENQSPYERESRQRPQGESEDEVLATSQRVQEILDEAGTGDEAEN